MPDHHIHSANDLPGGWFVHNLANRHADRCRPEHGNLVHDRRKHAGSGFGHCEVLHRSVHHFEFDSSQGGRHVGCNQSTHQLSGRIRICAQLCRKRYIYEELKPARIHRQVQTAAPPFYRSAPFSSGECVLKRQKPTGKTRRMELPIHKYSVIAGSSFRPCISSQIRVAQEAASFQFQTDDQLPIAE